MYTGCAPDIEVPRDDYPIIITPMFSDPCDKVLIIHASVYAKYLGRLNVVFDEDGCVSEWYGNPILLDKNVEEGRPIASSFYLHFFNLIKHHCTLN